MAVGQVEYKTIKTAAEITDAEQGLVECVFAVMGNVDMGGDMLVPGAFAKTFLERGHKVKVLDQHNAGSIMAVLGRPVELREISRDELPDMVKAFYPEAVGGAKARVQFLLDTPEGLGAFRRLKAGAVDEWSFAYQAVNPEFIRAADGATVRRLSEVKLLEISPVIWGMNPATTTTGAKASDSDSGEDSGKAGENRAGEAKAGQVIARRNKKRLQEIRRLLREIEEDGGFTLDEDEDEGKADLGKAGEESDQGTEEKGDAGAGPGSGEQPETPPTTETFDMSALDAIRTQIELLELEV